VGLVLVSRTGDVGWTERKHKVPKCRPIRTHKGCASILTIRRWPWKLESA